MRQYVTEDYEVVVDKGPDGDMVYKIVNKETEVHEYSDYLLSRTIDTLIQMQERLEDVRSKFFTVDKPKLLTMVKDNGEDSLH